MRKQGIIIEKEPNGVKKRRQANYTTRHLKNIRNMICLKSLAAIDLKAKSCILITLTTKTTIMRGEFNI